MVHSSSKIVTIPSIFSFPPVWSQQSSEVLCQREKPKVAEALQLFKLTGRSNSFPVPNSEKINSLHATCNLPSLDIGNNEDVEDSHVVC